MQIKKSAYVASLEKLKSFPGAGKPEIALAGRSNVGKSSLINSLCHSSHLARTSSEPGKTRMVNIYSVNDSFMLVDLPGYGFAKAPGSERRRWVDMIEGYLSGSKSLRHVFLLVDIRHDPTDDDKQMADYLRHYGLPFTVIANKTDKLSKTAAARMIPGICRKLVVQPWQVLTYSSETNDGRDELLKAIDKILHPVKTDDSGIVIPEDLSINDGPTREETV